MSDICGINGLSCIKCQPCCANRKMEKHTNYVMGLEEENEYLRSKVTQLERELSDINFLDGYEKIPYWMRPDFKMPDFTCKTDSSGNYNPNKSHTTSTTLNDYPIGIGSYPRQKNNA